MLTFGNTTYEGNSGVYHSLLQFDWEKARFVFLALHLFGGARGVCWPSYKLKQGLGRDVGKVLVEFR